MKRSIAILLLAILALASMAMMLGDYPETIVMTAKKGDVTFPHKAHIEHGKMACKECHHTLAGDMDMPTQKCSDCHGKDDAPSMKKAGHGNCLSCHKKSGKEGAPTKCKQCHVK